MRMLGEWYTHLHGPPKYTASNNVNDVEGACKYRKDLVKFDYSCFGCVHTNYDGFACMAFAAEGTVVHMVGIDPKIGFCEMYSKGRKQK